MRTYTTAQVRNLALIHLGVLPTGETPSAADAELAEIALDAVHEELEGLGLLNWPVCEVPSNVVLAVASLTASKLVNAFGLGDAQAARYAADGAAAMTQIHQQTTVGHSGTTRAVYY
jgi:hypothetical protein